MQVDQSGGAHDAAHSRTFIRASRLSLAMHYVIQVLNIFAVIALAWVVIRWRALFADKSAALAFALVVAVACSALIPRIALLSAIDSAMFPGTSLRYLSAGVFAAWFGVISVVALVLRAIVSNLVRRRRAAA